jgi:cell division protein ZapA
VARKPVVAYIAGQRYVVRSDADKSYVQTLARYVDERVKEIQRTSRPASTQSLAVLAALNIADDLFQERQRRSELKRKVRERSQAVINYLDKEVKTRLQHRE